MILQFKGITRHKVDPNNVLEGAIDKLDECLIIGVDKEGFNYYASSESDVPKLVYQLELLKKHLLDEVIFE